MSRIAVIGSGISGMGAAWLLSKKYEVHLFEKEPRIGGHTHTHSISTSKGIRPIDTGFIVHNNETYPNLVRLFAELGIEREKSDMSFGVTDAATGREYSSRGLKGFFATFSNLFRPAHYKLLVEMIRFNRYSLEFLKSNDAIEITLGEYLRRGNFSDDFKRLYLYPMAASVWSTSIEEIDGFPALTLLRFFQNHGFLTIDGHFQWYVLKGGSSSYIPALTAPYADRIHTDCHICSVSIQDDKPTLQFMDGSSQSFDEVVFACHGPQSLALLGDATPVEKEVLGSFRTNRNETTLHNDEASLPKRLKARAAWNYLLKRESSAPVLTYHMNKLQNLDTPEDYCVTLNDTESIDASKVLMSMTYYHPLYTLEAVRAQTRWSEVSGVRHLHFCGAYWFYGFHEDGFLSAIRVARSLGVEW